MSIERPCPPGSEYKACGPLIQPRCSDPKGVDGCVEGCFCLEGYLFSLLLNRCVKTCGRYGHTHTHTHTCNVNISMHFTITLWYSWSWYSTVITNYSIYTNSNCRIWMARISYRRGQGWSLCQAVEERDYRYKIHCYYDSCWTTIWLVIAITLSSYIHVLYIIIFPRITIPP